MKLKLITISLFIFSQSHADLTLTIGGDVNFNKNLQVTNLEGYVSSSTKKVTPWVDYTKNIAHLINADLNYANIETVVTENTKLVPAKKAFVFGTHPQAIQHMIDIGFNVFNLANNHTYDYGTRGMQETLDSMLSLKDKNPDIHYQGIGYKNDLYKPYVFQIKGYTIAMASLSIVTDGFKFSDNELGILDIRNKAEFNKALVEMKNTTADYKILSLHFGKEGQTKLDAGQKKYYESAIDQGDVDLIIGHHSHTVRPVQKYKNKFIFYGLGNYLMIGSKNLSDSPAEIDYGLLSKLNLKINPDTNRLEPSRIELLPLTNTHSSVRLFPANKADERLKILKSLGKDQLADDALDFKIIQGKGLYCISEKCL